MFLSNGATRIFCGVHVMVLFPVPPDTPLTVKVLLPVPFEPNVNVLLPLEPLVLMLPIVNVLLPRPVAPIVKVLFLSLIHI